MHGHHPGLMVIGDAVSLVAAVGVFFNWYPDHVNVIVGTLAILYYLFQFGQWFVRKVGKSARR